MCTSKVCQPELRTLEHAEDLRFSPTAVSLLFDILSDAEDGVGGCHLI